MYTFFKDFINRIKQWENIWLWLLLGAALYTRLSYFYVLLGSEAGLPKTQDSYWYIDNANELLQSFQISMDLNGLLYIGYYGFLAIMLLIFKTETSMIVLQVLLNALSVVFVYRISEMIFNRRTAVIAGILYVFSYEVKFWSVYLLTDSWFVSVLILSVYLWLQYDKNAKRGYLYAFVSLMIYMAFVRPAGVLIVAFYATFLLVCFRHQITGFMLKRKYILVLILLAFTGLSCIAYVLMTGPLGMSFYWNFRWLLYGNYAYGQIFDLSTPYDRVFQANKKINYANNFVISFFINNALDIFKLYFRRFGSFWGELWIWHYNVKSLGQAVRYFINFLPILLVFAGMIKVLAGKAANKAVIIFIPVIASVLFCVLFFIDSGWRYRLPSVPFNGIFMSAAIDYIIVKTTQVGKGKQGDGSCASLK